MLLLPPGTWWPVLSGHRSHFELVSRSEIGLFNFCTAFQI